MTILAIGEITIANIDDINISTDQPIDPVPDQLWLDTSTVPNVLKRWGWIEDEERWGWLNASPTSPEDIGAEEEGAAAGALVDAKNSIAYELGYTDFADMVTKAQIHGKTIIEGGYLNTDLIDAGSIVAGHIAAGTITTGHINMLGLDAGVIKTGKLDADVVQVGASSTFDPGYNPSEREPAIVKGPTEPGIAVDFSRPSPATHPETGAEVPADTPIFMTFAGDKKGLLMEEGTINLLTANQSSFETSSVSHAAIRCVREQSSDWSKHGSCSQKITITDATNDSYIWYRCAVGSHTAGTLFIAQAVVYLPPDNWYIGKNMQIRIRFEGGVNPAGGFFEKSLNLCEGENLLWVAGPLDYVDREFVEWFLWEAGAGNRAPVGTFFYTDCHQVEVKAGTAYPTSWQLGGQTRENPTAKIILTEILPDEFGIGLMCKMLQAQNVKSRTFWQAGDYRCYFDMMSSRVKFTNGMVTVEMAETEWLAGDTIGVYAGRAAGKLFIQAKIARVVNGKAEQSGDAADSVTNLHIGSKPDGSETANAVIADFTLHDRPGDIDLEGYLSRVPGGGV